MNNWNPRLQTLKASSGKCAKRKAGMQAWSLISDSMKKHCLGEPKTPRSMALLAACVQCPMVMTEEMDRFLNRSVWRACAPDEDM